MSRAALQSWLQRAKGRRLDRVDWTDRPSVPHKTRRTHRTIEDQIVMLRRELKESSALGEYGAHALHREMTARGFAVLPSVRTIGRIMERRGALDGRKRVRRPPPPRGWYLPDVAQAAVELDSFDIVEGLVIEGGTEVEVLNGISLHGGLPASWQKSAITARIIVKALLSHWRHFGLPGYAQFDNDTRFQGAHQYPDTVGRVTRACLSLGVVPVFVPPVEPGFQASIEAFNGRWQAKVWTRFHHTSLADLQGRAGHHLAACRERAAARIDAAPQRRRFPQSWRLDLRDPLRGKIIFLRRTNEDGILNLLGHRFPVDRQWSHRLVRSEVDLDANKIRFFALRRRDPHNHFPLGEVSHEIPNTSFIDRP